MPEGQSASRMAVQVELVCVGEMRAVAISRIQRQHHQFTRRDNDVAHRDLRRGEPEARRPDTPVESQQFLDGRGHKRQVRLQLRELTGVGEQVAHRVTDLVRRRLGTRDHEQEDHCHELALGQPVAVVGDSHQRADQCVVGTGALGVDERVRVLDELT